MEKQEIARVPKRRGTSDRIRENPQGNTSMIASVGERGSFEVT